MSDFFNNPLVLSQLLIVGSLSCLISGLIVLSSGIHGRFTLDRLHGVQRMHHHPVSRVGGLAVFMAIVITNQFSKYDALHAQLDTIELLGFIVFSFGFLEDLTQKVGITIRLWATLLPGIVGYYLTGLYLHDLDFALLNDALAFLPVGLAFTAFAICGVTHAINFIDGLNGLAGWACLFILFGLMIISLSVGDINGASIALIFVAAILGALFWNWPFGKIFFGDGGAYFIGMSIGWLAVMLSIQNTQVSAWSMLLLCAYPITEALHSIWRRFQSKLSPGKPDRSHLHQIFAEAVVYTNARFKTLSPIVKNSLSGFLVSLITLPGVFGAIVFYEDKWVCIGLYIVFAIAYIYFYQSLWSSLRHHRHLASPKKKGGD